MHIRNNFKLTIAASYIGLVTQAIVNNFIPLLFLTFQKSYNVSVEQIALLISLNFVTQLLTDLVAVKLIPKIGYRIAITSAHIFAAIGLLLLVVLPDIIGYTGLILSVVIYAVGGGLLEVLTSPIVEACPTNNKNAHMNFLHSAYCWGSVLVVLLSTMFFSIFGINNWKYMSLIWMLVPLFNTILFMLVPIRTLEEEAGSMPVRSIAKSGTFWLLMLLMLCAGASELAVAQWASAFAEDALGVSKTVSDIAGPCMFAVLMGTSRVAFGVLGNKINLEKGLVLSAVLCFIGYTMIALPSSPVIPLIGCSVCGFAVGNMWTGTFNLATKYLKTGGTAMFALLALAGDSGCSTGPGLVGLVTGATNNMHTGFLVAMIFPILMIVGVLTLKIRKGDNL